MTRSLLKISSVIKRVYSNCATRMTCSGIIPDLICEGPTQTCAVSYANVCINLGNEIYPTDVKDTPCVKWCAKDDCFYTLLFLDADVPSRKEPSERSWLHWLVINIPGANVTKGNEIAGYLGALPNRNTKQHRYVFLVYLQQCGHSDLDKPHIPSNSAVGRRQFDLNCFIKDRKLGYPAAGNFFFAEWDCYVQTLRKKLGLSC